MPAADAVLLAEPSGLRQRLPAFTVAYLAVFLAVGLAVELLHFDRLVHALGFGFATLACGKVLRSWLPAGRITPGMAVFVVLAGLGVGAVNEIVEFAATLMLPETNVGGYVNTGWDLVFDTIGAIVAAWWLVRSSSAEPALAPEAGPPPTPAGRRP